MAAKQMTNIISERHPLPEQISCGVPYSCFYFYEIRYTKLLSPQEHRLVESWLLSWQVKEQISYIIKERRSLRICMPCSISFQNRPEAGQPMSGAKNTQKMSCFEVTTTFQCYAAFPWDCKCCCTRQSNAFCDIECPYCTWRSDAFIDIKCLDCHHPCYALTGQVIFRVLVVLIDLIPPIALSEAKSCVVQGLRHQPR